jgi:GNAT superfamily N-acetyltransferase
LPDNTNAAMFTARVNESARAELRAHFLAFGSEDRRLRFGIPARDITINRYVDSIDFSRDAVFGVQGDGRQFDGVMHLALEKNHAEIGVSVLRSCRGRGIGTALVSRAAMHARNRGIDVLFMQCLSENCAIMRIARSLGMRVVTEGNESEATLPLPAANALSMVREMAANKIALCDAALRETLFARTATSLAAPTVPPGVKDNADL